MTTIAEGVIVSVIHPCLFCGSDIPDGSKLCCGASLCAEFLSIIQKTGAAGAWLALRLVSAVPKILITGEPAKVNAWLMERGIAQPP